MANNVKIITTTVPNGIRQEGNKYILSFSVFLSPRLPDTGRLKDYFEILEWSHFVQEIRNLFFKKSLSSNLLEADFYEKKEIKKLEEETKKNVTYIEVGNPITISKHEIELIENNFLAAEDEWKKVFSENNFVSGWLINDAKYKISASVTSKEIEDVINSSFDNSIKKLNLKIREIESNQSEESVQFYYSQIQNLKIVKSNILKDEAEILNNIRNFITPTYNKYFSMISLEIFEKTKNELEAGFNNIIRKFKDRLQAIKAEEEVRALNQANGEFHKKLSIMGKYPDLLRRYGWLWDFEMEFEDKIPDEIFNNTFFIQFKGFDNLKTINDSSKVDNELFSEYENRLKIMDSTGNEYTLESKYFENSFKKAFKEVEFLNTLTYCELSKDVFKYAHDKRVNQEITPTKKEFIVNGYLNAALLQPSLINTKQVVEKISNANSKPVEVESSGISLKIKNLDKIIDNIYQNQPAQNQTNGDKNKDYLIFGHHLDEGYRVDIIGFDGTNDKPLNIKFGTLTARHSIYKLNNQNNEDDYFYKSVNHGWITETAQNGRNPNDLNVDEELFRWNGWSLVCPMPGKYDEINTEGFSKDDGSDLCNEIIVKSIVPSSDSTNLKINDNDKLIPLRFGKKYSFSLRVADICGNGKKNDVYKFEDEIKKTDSQIWSKPIEYKRTQRVDTPTIFFTEKDKHYLFPKKRLKTDYKGKELTTLVIKSIVQSNELICINKEGESRCIAPPRVELNFVNYHAVFDKLYTENLEKGKNLDDIFDKIDELHCFSDSITVRDNLGDTKQIPRGVKHNDNVAFLHDPVVSGYTFFHAESHTDKHLNLTHDSYYLKSKKKVFDKLAKKYTKLTLKGGENFRITTSDNAVDFVLKAGEEIRPEDANSPSLNNRILVYCQIEEKYKKIFDLYDEQKKLDWNKILSNPLKLNLIHAVQKPCLIKTKYPTSNSAFQSNIRAKEVWLNNREVASTSAQVNFSFDLFPCLTTESMSLHVCYNDFIGNRTNNDGFDIMKVDKAIKKDIPPICQEEKVYFEQDQFEHFFGDTKHRWVNYKIEAISKFKQYFDEEKLKPENVNNIGFFSVYGEIDNKDTFIKSICRLENDGTVKLNILSTAKPDGLIIHSITPMLRWEKEGNSVKRICDTFRVFFDNEWYSSGEDEKIAVLFDENLNTVSDYTEKIISQFGLDPITKVELNKSFKITKEFFFEGAKRTIELKRNHILPNPSSPNDIEDKFEKKEISAAIYGVHYSSEKKKWYVDIKLNNDYDLIMKNYMPFVKFALCRYQEHSVKNDTIDCRFSPVSLTDFSQILPQREIIIENAQVKYICGYQYPSQSAVKNTRLPNEVYLVKENKNSDLIELDKNPEYYESIPISIISDNQTLMFKKEQFNRIEEYEFYTETEEKFKINKLKNPRNNYTKRLVFHYNF